MGKPTKLASSTGPTRRKVLTTALAAGVGVASARILGLRNLNSPASADVSDPMAAAATMDPMGMYGDTVEEIDPLSLIPDDAFFGSQSLDSSILPELRPAVALPPVSSNGVASGPGVLQPPISGITAPRIAGNLDWVSPLTRESAKITHLLRRATFGYTEAELDRALSEGYARTVERLIETPFAEPPAFGQRPAATPSPTPRASASMSGRPAASGSARPAASGSAMASASSMASSASPRPSANATAAPSTSPRPSASAAAMTSAKPSASGMAMPSASGMAAASGSPAPLLNTQSINLQNLQIWWLDWMTQSPTPFGEKMTLFLHGHFVSDYRKVGTNSPAMYWQNLTWRRIAMSDLKSMLLQVTPDLAMLRYLDLAVSTGRNPNENFARELLELFTMGVGNYTEDDVKAAAKALAGWRLPSRNENTAMRGIFDARRAYTAGPLTFLGKTATFDTAGIVDQILAQDVTATYLAREVARFFVSPSATDQYVARLADTFRRSKYDMKSLMRTVFTSPEFTNTDAFRVLIKSPTEYMIGAAKALGVTNLSRTMAGYGPALGQNLFDPPSVAGWGDNASWISSNTMLQRANFASNVLTSLRTLPSAARAHDRLLDGVLGPGTVQELNQTRDDRSRWFAVFVSPEFQLK
jgi:uncharacterized protein (DUF1800 family)